VNNDTLGIIAGVVTALGMATFIVVWNTYWAYQRRARILRMSGSLSQRYKGDSYSRWISRTPIELEFAQGKAEATLKLTKFDPKTDTVVLRLTVKGWPDRSDRYEIYPQRLYHRAAKLVGMQDVTLGSPAFDDDYIVSSNSDDLVQRLAKTNALATIELLRDLPSDKDIYIRLLDGEFEIHIKELAAEYEILAACVDNSLTLWETLLQSSVPNTEPDGGLLQSPVCQVCGDGIELPVHCCKCRTPHHRDCWEYYGSCSVYACGEKRTAEAIRKVNRFHALVPRSSWFDKVSPKHRKQVKKNLKERKKRKTRLKERRKRAERRR